MNKMKFIKISNMIYLTSEDEETCYQGWDESQFTERKMKNAMNRYKKCYLGNVEFEICL